MFSRLFYKMPKPSTYKRYKKRNDMKRKRGGTKKRRNSQKKRDYKRRNDMTYYKYYY